MSVAFAFTDILLGILHEIGVQYIIVRQEFLGIVDYLAFGQDKHSRYTYLFDKVGIVAYKQYRARVVAEVFAYDRLRIGIEMVGRLVEYQQVCAFEQKLA